jgi:hypothetical protein
VVNLDIATIDGATAVALITTDAFVDSQHKRLTTESRVTHAHAHSSSPLCRALFQGVSMHFTRLKDLALRTALVEVPCRTNARRYIRTREKQAWMKFHSRPYFDIVRLASFRILGASLLFSKDWKIGVSAFFCLLSNTAADANKGRLSRFPSFIAD